MIKVVTIIALFLSTRIYGQVPKERAYKNIDGLTIAESFSRQDISDGFYISNGFGGYDFRLYSNMTFQKIDFDCMASFKVDSGSWTIKNHNTVVLKSKELTLYFDVVKFDDFYFFILPTQRQKFVKDLQATKNQFKNAESFMINYKTYSKYYLIGYNLARKYYAKELEHDAGS
ncbi:MAG: hypothetical protein ABUL44_00015 [Flavobacterium sp.]